MIIRFYPAVNWIPCFLSKICKWLSLLFLDIFAFADVLNYPLRLLILYIWRIDSRFSLKINIVYRIIYSLLPLWIQESRGRVLTSGQLYLGFLLFLLFWHLFFRRWMNSSLGFFSRRRLRYSISIVAHFIIDLLDFILIYNILEEKVGKN